MRDNPDGFYFNDADIRAMSDEQLQAAYDWILAEQERRDLKMRSFPYKYLEDNDLAEVIKEAQEEARHRKDKVDRGDLGGWKSDIDGDKSY